MKKKCSNCGEVKEKIEYQHRAMSKDGLTASCKKCLAIRDKKRESPKRREARRIYAKTPQGIEAMKRGRIKWASENKDKISESHRKWISENQNKRAAHVILGNAVRDGRINKGPCEVCGDDKLVHGHHEDYAKPLEVTWLCREHHVCRHNEIREGL